MACEMSFPETSNDNDGIKPTNYMDIKLATTVLNKLQTNDLKLSILFRKPFYANTALVAKPNCNQNTCEIIRKNVYYIARKSNNLDNLLAQLVQFGVLTLDERKEIEEQSSPLLQAVLTFSKIITKEEARFPIFLDILRSTENKNIAELIESNMVEEATNRYEEPLNGATSLSHSIPDQHSFNSAEIYSDDSTGWICTSCTLYNKDIHRQVCILCCRSRNGDIQVTLVCAKCTLINEPGIKICQMCEENLETQYD